MDRERWCSTSEALVLIVAVAVFVAMALLCLAGCVVAFLLTAAAAEGGTDWSAFIGTV